MIYVQEINYHTKNIRHRHVHVQSWTRDYIQVHVYMKTNTNTIKYRIKYIVTHQSGETQNEARTLT